MPADRWERIEQLCQEALERPPEQQTVFLESACGSDEELRREVESLLVHRERAETFIESPAMHIAARALSADEARPTTETSRHIGRLISHYRVVEKIASGGMGDVYRAVRADGTFEKQVAIKLIQGARSTDFFLARFQNERQILADLEHPNIARLLDGGSTEEGLPYVIMEYVEGLPIDEFCNHNRLSVRERLEIFRTVCLAVQHAHQNLVVHRDLKPGNILVTADGVPKLLDFGIAKILNPQRGEDILQPTVTFLRLLTPDYASPEQVRNEPISTASDVYSLGVILYALLTGRSPYRVTTSSPQEMLRAICYTEPEKPSTAIGSTSESADAAEKTASTPEEISRLRADSPGKLRQRISGDLDNIVLKAIRKEPHERYNSVDQLSEDIRRHLEHLPVLARKSTVAYRCRKYVLRHKVGAAAAALVFLSLLSGVVLTLREARIARANELRAQRRFNDVRKLSNSLIFEIHDSIQGLPGATPARKVLLERAREYLDGLASESSRDLSLQRDLAAAYERVGSLQGISLDANIGETEAGISSLQKAVSIADAVARANPGNLNDQLNAAHAHSQLSSLLGNSGRPGAREELEKAIAITNRLLSIDTSNPKVLIEQGVEYDRLAFFQDDAGDVEGAAESLKKGLATGEAILKSAPQDKKQMNRVAIGRVKLGNELVLLGRRKEAIEYNGAGLDLYETLAQDKTNAKARRELAVTLGFRGNIQMMNGEVEEALTNYQRSFAIVQELEKADPQNVLYQLDVAGGTASVGRALACTGKDREGLAMLEKAIGVLQENYARNHSYTDIPYWIGQDHIWRGEILIRAGHIRSALNEYRRGIASLESLMGGAVGTSTRCDIAQSYAKVAGALALTGNNSEASTFYSKALEIAEPRASAKPPNVLALYAAADAYFGMGELAKRTAQQSTSASREEREHHSKEACGWYRKSAEAWRQLPNPARTTPSGFTVGDPGTVARNLRGCDARFLGPQQP